MKIRRFIRKRRRKAARRLNDQFNAVHATREERIAVNAALRELDRIAAVHSVPPTIVAHGKDVTTRTSLAYIHVRGGQR